MPSHTSGALTGGRAPQAQAAPLPKRRSDRLPARPVPSPTLRPQPSDDAELHRIRDALDHAAHAGLARLTGGLSPAAVADAYMDWAVQSRHLAGQAGRTRREGSPQMGPAGAVRLALRQWRRHMRALHRAAAPGQTLCRSRVAAMALQSHSAGLPAPAAMVGQRDDRDRRRHQAASGRGRVHLAPDPRHGITVELPRDQPGRAAAHPGNGRPEPRAGLPQLPGRLGADRPLEASRRRGGLPGGPGCGRHAGQGDLPQPSHRADPVRANDRKGPAGADPDRARLDHEVLHPRPLARRTPSSATSRTRASRCSSSPGRTRPRRIGISAWTITGRSA